MKKDNSKTDKPIVRSLVVNAKDKGRKVLNNVAGNGVSGNVLPPNSHFLSPLQDYFMSHSVFNNTF